MSFDGRNSLWRKVIVSSWSRSYSPIDNCSLFIRHKEYYKQLATNTGWGAIHYSVSIASSSSAKAAGGFTQLHNNLCMSFWMATEGIVFLYCSYVCNCIKNPNFANCRFSFRKLQIFISFRFAPFHFASAVIIYRIIVLTYHTIYPKDDGSCLLWVMSTEISVEIAVDTAVDSRSIVGR